jgi:hypothetical protein
MVAGTSRTRSTRSTTRSPPSKPLTADRAAAQEKLPELDAAVADWRVLAEQVVDQPARLAELSDAMEEARVRFATANDELQQTTREARTRDLGRANVTTLALTIGLALLIGGLGVYLIERRRRNEEKARTSRESFNEALLLARTEEEANEVLVNQVERTLPNVTAVVLRRRPATGWLEAIGRSVESLGLSSEAGIIQRDTCLAARSRRVVSHDRESALFLCGFCGLLAAGTTCVPAFVGGEVIGSLLAVRSRAPSPESSKRVASAVTEAAPSHKNSPREYGARTSSHATAARSSCSCCPEPHGRRRLGSRPASWRS